MGVLHAYTDDFDTIIAESPEDALLVAREIYGKDYDLEPGDSYREIPADQTQRVYFEDEVYAERHCPSGQEVNYNEGRCLHYVDAPISAWIEKTGRNLLCSTEW